MRLASQDAVTALDPDFGVMAVQVGRHAWGLPELTMREKAFIFVAADMCRHTLGFPLQAHVSMARSNGVEVAAIREVVRHLAPYVGYPTAAETLMRLAEIEAGPPAGGPAPAGSPDGGPAGPADHNPAGPADHSPAGPADHSPAGPADHDPAGPAGGAAAGNVPAHGRASLPAAVVDALHRLDPDFARFVSDQFAQRWDRPGLSRRERALCTLATDVLLGTLDEPFRLHVRLALDSGADDRQVRSVLLLLAEFGIARCWQAYAALAAMAD